MLVSFHDSRPVSFSLAEDELATNTISNLEEEIHVAEANVEDKDQTENDANSEEEKEKELNVSQAETIVTSNSTKKTHGYNLRPNRGRDYSHKFAMLSLKAGIKRWGNKAKEVMLDELRLFLSEEVFKQLHNPTRKQMEIALCIHCFVIKKRDGGLKQKLLQMDALRVDTRKKRFIHLLLS